MIKAFILSDRFCSKSERNSATWVWTRILRWHLPLRHTVPPNKIWLCMFKYLCALFCKRSEKSYLMIFELGFHNFVQHCTSMKRNINLAYKEDSSCNDQIISSWLFPALQNDCENVSWLIQFVNLGLIRKPHFCMLYDYHSMYQLATDMMQCLFNLFREYIDC